MNIWLFLGIAYGLTAVAFASGIMASFFDEHPDGAPEYDEEQILSFASTAIAVSIIWPFFLLVAKVCIFVSKAKRRAAG